MHNIKIWLVIILISLAGCSHTADTKIYKETDPKVLYDEGKDYLAQEKYDAAIENFKTLEREYPASDLASEALLLRAYSYYQAEKYDESVDAIEEFGRLYPAHKDISYAYYLKALCYYDRIMDLHRDQHLTEQAVQALTEIRTRFPTSKYAKDAKWKLDFCFNTLAGKEMAVGRFYLKRNQYIAALGRFRTVVEKYDTTIFIPEALYRMSEIYYAWGIDTEALKYAQVLRYNFPNNEWTHRVDDLIGGRKLDMGRNDSMLTTMWKNIW